METQPAAAEAANEPLPPTIMTPGVFVDPLGTSESDRVIVYIGQRDKIGLIVDLDRDQVAPDPAPPVPAPTAPSRSPNAAAGILDRVRISASFSPVCDPDDTGNASPDDDLELDCFVFEADVNGSTPTREALLLAATSLIGQLNHFAYSILDQAQFGPPPAHPFDLAFLSQPIDALGLSTRSRNALRADGVRSVRDLVRLSEWHLLRARGIGKKGVADIKDALARHSLSLGMNFEPEPPTAVQFDALLFKRIDTLGLSTRSRNVLRDEGVRFVGDLVRLSVLDLLRIPTLGGKSLADIKDALARHSLSLGMNIENWPPEVLPPSDP